MHPRITLTTLDKGLAAVLSIIYQDTTVCNYKNLYTAVERGHDLTAKALVAFGVNTQQAINHAKSLGKEDLARTLQNFNLVDESILNALIYQSILHYEINNEAALTILDRLLKVKKTSERQTI